MGVWVRVLGVLLYIEMKETSFGSKPVPGSLRPVSTKQSKVGLIGSGGVDWFHIELCE